MIQTLASIAVIVTLGCAVLASGALAARAAFERFVAHQTDLALRDSVARFTADVRTIVAAQGASGPWPASQQTDPYPHAGSQPEALCTTDAGEPGCGFRYALTWTIDGHSAAGGAAAGSDVANNLQRAVIDEERIAGSVSVRLIDRRGAVVAARARTVTLRVFDAAPYAVVSGMRELTTLAGTRDAAQGDTGGTGSRDGTGILADEPAPDPANPDRYRDTRIKVDMDCAEASPNFDESNPFADDAPAGDDGLPWGVSGAAFEAPCAPTYAQQITLNAPPGLAYPANPFPINVFAQAYWSTGDAGGSAWSP